MDLKSGQPSRNLIDLIGAVLHDHRIGLLGSDQDAADHILIAMRDATDPMCSAGDSAIAKGHSAVRVWREMIDSVREMA